MILAGDIGGTKTVLSLLEKEADGLLKCVREQTFASGEYDSFDDILNLFLPANIQLSSVCFGVAGPVVEQRCFATNLNWTLDAAILKTKLGTEKVRLLNDLEAMAFGMLHLEAEDFVELNPNAERQSGNIAVIAAGTGLGEAILYWDGRQYHAIASEGGHCSFAPQTVQQDKLLYFLRKQFPQHVSYERILSGVGFSHLYDFLVDSQFAPPCPAVPSAEYCNGNGADRNAVISRLGINGEDALCSEAVRMFVEIYGAEAGNLFMKSFATGGVFIGGGIGPKIRSAMQAGGFMMGFTAKGRFQTLLGKVSVKLALNPRTPLIGAMHYFDTAN
ncbi:glucokinase [Methylomonas methanica]|uniref:Glucokinase n=1 Tax=Methylomonas methanica (strain DSM 25384 / MC09) TaxID=857087 RepID=G0A3V0_METMM|nr:glucokinase [Methylomonas methanica]AEG02722.1 glucokinase [Methylomonas methanica MC09]